MNFFLQILLVNSLVGSFVFARDIALLSGGSVIIGSDTISCEIRPSLGQSTGTWEIPNHSSLFIFDSGDTCRLGIDLCSYFSDGGNIRIRFNTGSEYLCSFQSETVIQCNYTSGTHAFIMYRKV